MQVLQPRQPLIWITLLLIIRGGSGSLKVGGGASSNMAAMAACRLLFCQKVGEGGNCPPYSYASVLNQNSIS